MKTWKSRLVRITMIKLFERGLFDWIGDGDLAMLVKSLHKDILNSMGM